MIKGISTSQINHPVSFKEAPLVPASKNKSEEKKTTAKQQPANHSKTGKKYDRDTLLKNNLITNARISFDKITNAATVYPAKGITGNKNSNFYEFLTMGTVPYIIGSLTLMAVFNMTSKYFNAADKSKALKFGNKMALGVILYALGKELAKPLINVPVKLATGVDANLPYAKINYELPDNKYDTDITSIEYHKVFESVEFPRWDLLYADESKGQKRNAYYDKVAKKLGLGTNLKDSDQEVKPRIKEIITKSIAANNTIPYLWAAAGVALAMQEPWDYFFESFKTQLPAKQKMKKIVNALKTAAKESAKSLYNGGTKSTKTSKIAGKAAIFVPVIATVLGVLNIITGNSKPHNSKIGHPIEANRKQVIN